MAKIQGKGTLFQTKVSGSFVTVAQGVQIDGPSAEVQFEKTTDLASTYVDKRPVNVDLGTLSFTGFFDPNDATLALLRGETIAPPTAAREFKIQYPDGNTTKANDLINGFVKSYVPTGIERDKFIQAKMEIELTDFVDFNVGTP